MSRLNRENTLIENNLYPCAGMKEEDIKKTFVNIFTPYEEEINQIQNALFLHNIPLFVMIIVSFIAFWILNIILYSKLSSAVYLIIFIPLIYLPYILNLQKFFKKFYSKDFIVDESNPARILKLEEIISFTYKPFLLIWRIGFFVYRVFICPNPVDVIIFIISIVFVGFLGKSFNFVLIGGFKLLLILLFPIIFTKTPAGPIIKEFLMKKKNN